MSSSVSEMVNGAALHGDDGHADMELLRVHSKDLHDHMLQDVADCLQSRAFADMVIRCNDGGDREEEIWVHKVVLGAVSPYLRMLFEFHDDDDNVCLSLPDVPVSDVRMLLSVVYNGSVEASLDELRRVIFLARDLCVLIPVSAELLRSLDIDLPEYPKATEMPRRHTMQAPPPLRFKSINGGGINGKMPHMNSDAMVAPPLTSQLQPPPPPPLVKKVKTEALPPGILFPAAAAQPMGEEEALPMPSNCIKTAPDSYTCALCNATYGNMVSFRQHTKFHEDERDREQRNLMLNNMVSMCYNPASSVYTCEFCRSTYSHPGNFKQHLGKHERETGCVSSAYNAGYLGPSNDADAAIILSQNSAKPPTKPSAIMRPPPPTASFAAPASSNLSGANSHLSNVLRSAMADKVCSADASTGPLYHCEICGRDFKHPGNYKQHMSSHMRTVSSVGPRPPSLHSPSVPSPPSNPLLANRKPTPSATVTSNSSAAATFPKGKGVSGGSLKCEICDQVFESQIALYSHKQSRHAPTPLVSSDPLGARSLVTANGESVLANMYPCDEDNCFESFSKEGWLSKHKEQAHGKAYVASARGRLSCPICQKNFDRRKKLHRHMKVHSLPEKHYRHECDICGKKFTRPHHVRRHKMLHTGERPFQCDRCDMSFYREDKLREHKIKYCGVISQLRGDSGEVSNGITAANVDESSRISVSDGGNLEWERQMHEWDDDDDGEEEDDDDNDGSESGISAESPSAEVTEVKQEMEVVESIPDAL